MGWVRTQVKEIWGTPPLRIFGAILSSLHLLFALRWWQMDLPAMLAPGAEVICWPFVDHCESWRVFGVPILRTVLGVYALLAAATCAVVAVGRRPRWGWFLMLTLELLRLCILVQDYKLRLNQQTMSLLAGLVFLFVPDKLRTLQLLIALFYFWAGTLKLNAEWLTGAALYGQPLGVPLSWLPVACAYVAVLELVIVWGLFAKNRWIFWGAFLQLGLFALVSWPVVGFLYPCVMLGLLSLFPLSRRWAGPLDAQGQGKTSARWAPVAVGICFSVLQLIPRIQPGDTAVTGEGRWLSLHMFDALVDCRGQALLHLPGGHTRPVELQGGLSRRIQCEPIVYLNRVRNLCRRLKATGTTLARLDVRLESKRHSETDYRPVLQLEDVCTYPPHYRALGWNSWILR